MTAHATLLAAIAMTFAAGCMPTRPPQELVDARAAYARAYVGPAAEANVAGLHDAKRALDDAEAKYQEDASSEETRHLAYLAHRRVLLVETNARATIATEQRARAEHALTGAQARPKLREAERSDESVKAKTATVP